MLDFDEFFKNSKIQKSIDKENQSHSDKDQENYTYHFESTSQVKNGIKTGQSIEKKEKTLPNGKI